MTTTAALREAALAKLLEAKSLLQGDGTVLPADDANFTALLAAHRRLIDQAGGAGDAPSEIDGALEYYQGTGGRAMPAGRMVFGSAGGGGGHVGRRGMPNAGSWADAVSRSGRVIAGVIAPGSVAVSVPLQAQPVVDARRAVFVRQLIPQEPAPAGMFSYMRQTTRTNNAAAVAKLAKKPTSIYTLEKKEDRTRTIAHLSEPIARQDLSDASLLRTFVEDELRHGLDLAVDAQILSGSGTGENMTGILLTSGIQLQTIDTDLLVTTRKAITKLQILEFEDPAAFVMNPTDWEEVEFTSLAQFAANPNQPTPTAVLDRRLWSVPVIVTNAIAAGTALLGDFRGSSQLLVTEEARIDFSEATFDPDAFGVGDGASDFERNAIRGRAEGRWGLAVTRPLGFVKITF